MKLTVLSLLTLSVACASQRKTHTVRIELPEELQGHAAELRVLPQIAEAGRELGRGALALELKHDAGKVRLELPGACPLELDTRKLVDGQQMAIKSLFWLGPAERVIGLGRAFTINAEPACREAEARASSFEVKGGAPLTKIEVGANGRWFSAVTGGFLPDDARHGIIAVSAREQRERQSELAFRVWLADGSRLERRLLVSAVARSSGLPSVGLNHPVLLSNDDWQLLEKPTDSVATTRQAPGFSELVPDVPGTYRLRDARQRELSIHSGRYDQTPLDCGRAACHAEIAASVRESPMTHVLESDLGGCHELGDPTCAVGCHTTGEPGARDGGFSHVMAELGLSALPADYDALPRSLRRLGGVGCLACHGPTKLPSPEQRPSLLDNDVCAVCHDAPPRYGHVMALEASRMGHADSLPETRAEPCARCHTSWGALGRKAPPSVARGGGISCATCHDVHPHSSAAPSARPVPHGLLRDLPLPTSLGELPASFVGVSRVCINCHSPSTGLELPTASAAAILVGRGGRDPATGRAIELTFPHASAERGCLSCHDSGPAELVLGKTHGFVATEAACRRCHESTPNRDPSLAARARRLVERLSPEPRGVAAGRPRHAVSRSVSGPPEQTRALSNALLVLEDPAADVHNPAYARLLLDAAESGATR